MTACSTPPPSSATRTKVLIIGAGLAGLNTARLLQRQGIEATLLEGKSQAGGRTLSMKAQGQSINMGGVEIGDGYRRFIDLVNEYRLELVAPDKSQRGLTIHRNNQLLHADDWGTSNTNPLSGKLKSVLPSRLQSTLHGQQFPLSSTLDWLNADLAHYDIPESQRLSELGASDAALELINRAGNFNDINTVSALHTMRAIANYKYSDSTKTLRLKGGNDQLAVAIANSLSDVRYNHTVADITQTSQGIVVTCNNGSQFITEKLVLAVPFSVLRKINLNIELPAQHQQAITNLPYTRITKMVARVDKPFWETDGLPGNMWCDSAIERCFLTFNKQGDASYTFFVNGTGTQALDQLPPKQAQVWLLKQLAKIRPATQNALTPLAFHSWGNDPYALGAYAAFAPGQISQFANEMVKPVSNNVFFAGEHCSREASGMEGALESSEATYQQLIDRLQ